VPRASSSLDGPCASPERVWHCPDRESNRGWPIGATTGADWLVYWPAGKPACRSNVGDARCGNRGRKTRCNRGTYVAWASDSSWVKTTTTPKERKAERPKGRRNKSEEGRSDLSGSSEENPPGRKYNFKPAPLLHFHSVSGGTMIQPGMGGIDPAIRLT